MLTDNDVRQVLGATAFGEDGQKIGRVGQVFLDDETGKPEFVTVNTGLFGTKETFIPVQAALFNGDRLEVPFSRDKVKDAPNVEAQQGHLDGPEERRLYEYYGLAYDGSGADLGGLGTGTGLGLGNDTHADDERGVAATGDNLTGKDLRGNDLSDATGTGGTRTGTSGTPEAGTTSREAARARLRKLVTTEQETHTVPVGKEHIDTGGGIADRT